VFVVDVVATELWLSPYVSILHCEPFGVAVGGGRAWVATDRVVWALDAASGLARAAALTPRAGGFGFVSIFFAEGTAWLTSYNRGTLVRVAERLDGADGSGGR
jgi:hypothetical protein